MDYKAKYEEALERARALHDEAIDKGYVIDYVKDYETIFPELAESEDERIRKFLIDRLSCGIWKEEWPFSPPECVEYLEKQKDSIPYEKYVEDIAAIHAEARTKYHAGWNDGYEAKQKEHKPILEVFGFKVGDAVRLKDGDGRKHIIKSFEEVEGVHGPNFYHVEFEDDSARDGIYPGEEYPNGYYTQMEKYEQEQKPIEGKYYSSPDCGTTAGVWSEEDEKNFEWFDKLFRAESVVAGGRDIPQDKYLWFKSLRPQPQGTYKQVIHTIFGMLKDKDFYEIQPSHRVSLLNDIRVKCKDAIECAPILDEPSWKPSEEQMDSLNYGIYVLEEEGYDVTAREIEELYEQLKKLGYESRKSSKS